VSINIILDYRYNVLLCCINVRHRVFITLRLALLPSVTAMLFTFSRFLLFLLYISFVRKLCTRPVDFIFMKILDFTLACSTVPPFIVCHAHKYVTFVEILYFVECKITTWLLCENHHLACGMWAINKEILELGM
jgi:hypothetical protein